MGYGVIKKRIELFWRQCDIEHYYFFAIARLRHTGPLEYLPEATYKCSETAPHGEGHMTQPCNLFELIVVVNNVDRRFDLVAQVVPCDSKLGIKNSMNKVANMTNTAFFF